MRQRGPDSPLRVFEVWLIDGTLLYFAQPKVFSAAWVTPNLRVSLRGESGTEWRLRARLCFGNEMNLSLFSPSMVCLAAPRSVASIDRAATSWHEGCLYEFWASVVTKSSLPFKRSYETPQDTVHAGGLLKARLIAF
jgi:hypothetical protein